MTITILTESSSRQEWLDAYKDNLIKIVIDHKKTCDGNCGISLCLIEQMALEFGITLTDTERVIFS